MRHLYDKVHLNRTSAHRKALFGNLSAALFSHKRIVTTLAKAKYARRFAERMITFARRNDLTARRHVLKFIRDKAVVKTLFDELGPHFKNRNGGYTRIIKLGPRRGDAAPMALLELVGFDDVTTVEPKKSSKSRLKAAQRAATQTKKDEKAESPEPEKEKKSTTVKKTAAEPDVSEPSGEELTAPEEPTDMKLEGESPGKSVDDNTINGGEDTSTDEQVSPSTEVESQEEQNDEDKKPSDKEDN